MFGAPNKLQTFATKIPILTQFDTYFGGQKGLNLTNKHKNTLTTNLQAAHCEDVNLLSG